MITNLTVTEYTEEYYKEHAEKGLDYLGHGYWQEQYALMVLDACNTSGVVMDAGCACGSILQGFKKAGQKVMGFDLNEHMIAIGREHFSFTEDELQCKSISNTGLKEESVDLVHSAQVLEHIDDKYIDEILAEFMYVLKPEGKAFLCLDAIKFGEDKEMYMGDPTHINIQPTAYWAKKFQKHGFCFDVEAFTKFVNSPYKPETDSNKNFFNHYPYWTTFTLIKL